MTEDAIHRREALLYADEASPSLPVCDHYSGVEARMRKSLALQAELGPAFDVTLDCEDGAPVVGETGHAHMAAKFVMSATNRFGRAGSGLAYLMCPKAERPGRRETRLR